MSYGKWDPRRLFVPAPQGLGDASPLWQSTPAPRAVLCLHGFTGTPYEVRPLARALAAQGFAVAAPILAGHGDSAEALAETHWQDWLGSARDAAARLRKESGAQWLGIAGFSMGGLLALRLAHESPTMVNALAIMSSPLRLHRGQRAGIRALAGLPSFLRHGPLTNVPKLLGCDVQDEQVRAEVPSLTVTPIPALAQLLDLMNVARADLPAVRAPTVVVYGKRDRTVPFEDALEIAGSLGSDIVERLWLERSGHLVCVDVEKQELARHLVKFFGEHLR